MPADDMPPLVTPCFRCGGPVENPVADMGHVLGEERDRLPLCLDCLDLLGADVEAFWRPLRRPGDA